MKIFGIAAMGVSFLIAGVEPATLQNTAQLLVVTTKDWQSPDATPVKMAWGGGEGCIRSLPGRNLSKKREMAKRRQVSLDSKTVLGISLFLSAIPMLFTKKQTTV